MINNINVGLMQLEWVKKELKWIIYELNKFLKLFLYKKSFAILFYSILPDHWIARIITEKFGVLFVNIGDSFAISFDYQLKGK
jgi:hypothetical protein